jgi:hypothetical protein
MFHQLIVIVVHGLNVLLVAHLASRHLLLGVLIVPLLVSMHDLNLSIAASVRLLEQLRLLDTRP